MPAQYETCFTVSGNNGTVGVNLLREVTERITGELLSSTADIADKGAPDVETGSTETAGYTRISAERNYPADLQYRVRLEVRLCTRGDEIETEIRSRFLSIDNAAPPDYLAGPPRLLRFITGEFQCSSGLEAVSPRFRRIVKTDVETFVEESVLNPQRHLPILAVTEDQRGVPILDPDALQRTVLGVASVALLEKAAATEMTRHLGHWFTSANGSIQILWPGCRPEANGEGPRIQYNKGVVARKNVSDLLRELQQACVSNAHESDFDSVFNDARISVVLERNRILEEQQTFDGGKGTSNDNEVADLKRKLRKEQLARREVNRRWQNALATVTQLEQEIAEAHNTIGELSAPQSTVPESQEEREITRKLRAENRQLRKEQSKLKEANTKLNDDNQALRQRERQSKSDFYIIRLVSPHPGNVTVLNYALNLYRDPMRNFIMRKLSANNEQELKEILYRSIDLTKEPPGKPGVEIIDVNNFQDIVDSNREHFADAQSLSRKLNEIRVVRNRVAHPPPGGVKGDFTQDGLTAIAEALETIGATQEVMEVAGLRDRIYSN